jgi:hypothetical protein
VWLLRDHHDHRGQVGDHPIVRRKMKDDVRQNVRPD